MTVKEQLIARLSGQGDPGTIFLPDLTLWYQWHHNQGTLPAEWRDLSLADIARDLGTPIWQVHQPWTVSFPGVRIERRQSDDQRVIDYHTPSGVLTARWVIGPDGDWWQEEHLVKESADIPAARFLTEALSYTLEPAGLAQRRKAVGDDGVLALALPRRPFSDLLHDYVGWGSGLLLLMGPEKRALFEIHDLLDVKLQQLVNQIATLSDAVILSPDNLDGQYISPRIFEQHLAASYQQTTETLHQAGKLLVVHIGGPFRRLLAPLAAAGVDVVEGISGPPQGDASLAQARQEAGAGLTLWGGISQDLLIAPREWSEFEAAVAQASQQAQENGNCLLGVADRVPTTAELDRLRWLAATLP